MSGLAFVRTGLSCLVRRIRFLAPLLRIKDYTTIYAQKKLIYRTPYGYGPFPIGRGIGTYEID